MPPHDVSGGKQDKGDFGQKLAKKRSQEFNDKVATWNLTGGGMFSDSVEKEKTADALSKTASKKKDEDEAIITIVEPDDIAIDGTDDNAAAGISSAEKIVERRFSRNVDLHRKAWVRRKSKSQTDKIAVPDVPEPELKHVGTPKKRVISDGHWRRDRAKLSPEEKPIPIPKPLVIRQSKASIGLSLAKGLPDESEPKPLRTRHRRRSRPRSRSTSPGRSATPDFESSGTKLFVKRRDITMRSESRPASRELRSSTSGYTDSSATKREVRTRDTSPLGSPIKMTRHTPEPANVVERYLKALSPAEFFDPNRNTPNSAPPVTRRKHVRSEQTTDIFDGSLDQPPSAPPKVFGNRIDGWLATTSDSFAASDNTGNTSRQSRADLPPLRRPDSGVYSDGSAGSPTLKRRGARRTATSPVKNRQSRDSTPIMSSPAPTERKSSRALPPIPRRISDRYTDQQSSEHGQLVLASAAVSLLSDGEEPRHAGELKRRLTKHSDLMSVLSVQRSGSKVVRSRPSTRTRRGTLDLTIEDIMNEVSADEMKYQRELRTLVDGVIPVLLQHVLSQSDVVAKSNLLGKKSRDGEAVTKPIVDMGVSLERLKSVHRRIPLHNHEELLTWAAGASAIYRDYLAVWRMGFQDIVVNLAPAEPSTSAKESNLGDNGERVDVAFLLKRPLVRVKHLSKTFEALLQGSVSTAAADMHGVYLQLVEDAKQRSNEEKGRLEDEAAASIDPTRAREPRTLAPIAGVQIDTSRRVRARDFFDLDLRHSNGQQLNCKIELIMRDDAVGSGTAGDLLFCEVSTTGRWLLFPPVHTTMISARKGRKDRQLVVMLRGYQNNGREWREVMALEADDDEAILEWLTMLPATPVPRNLAAKSSFDVSSGALISGALPEPEVLELSRMPSAKENEVPIGERYDDASTVWDASEVNSDAGDHVETTMHRRRTIRHRSHPASTIVEEPYPEIPPTHVQARSVDNGRPASAYTARPISEDTSARSRWTSRANSTKTPVGVWLPQPDEHEEGEEERRAARPDFKRRPSSVPSGDLPSIPKLRHTSQQTPRPKRADQGDPDSAPAKLQRRRTPPERTVSEDEDSPTKAKRQSSGFRASLIPSLTPAFLKRHRRPSSPLKHEYEPSDDSSSESEVSAADKDESFTSDSTVEALQEDKLPLQDEQVSTVGELRTFPTFGGYKPMRQATPPESLYSPSDPSLAPSQSASQAPYRTVPVQESKIRETTASMFVWSDSGAWESLHPEECCIIVTPGLIEAFDTAQAHAAPAQDEEGAMQSPSMRGVKPLVALEMTPLVPLRRGTALDISIRSPPTTNSLYRTGNNIMFRSRNAEECEILYHMLNRARIDNPTYIALQRARGPVAQSNWGEIMDQRANSRASGSWWNIGSRKSTTYRSKALSRPQSIAATESSVGTLNTAFSALRRFSGSNRFFNIAKSTITSRQGSRSTYSDSLESGVTSPVVIDPSMGTPLGLTNMKIRLYVRETASKWRDMGAARLTILIPPRPDPTLPANPSTTGREKRVIITGKNQGVMLLDKTLGEACFERIARTGIAVSVWEENVDGLVATTGGVLTAKTKVYMIQMKSDREAAYTFGLVGKLRY